METRCQACYTSYSRLLAVWDAELLYRGGLFWRGRWGAGIPEV